LRMPGARVVGEVGGVRLHHDRHEARVGLPHFNCCLISTAASFQPQPAPLDGPSPHILASALVRTRDPALVEIGAERARVVPWRGSTRTAYLAPVPDAPPPSRDFIERCVDRMAAPGYDGVVAP